jgi:hypothetical protein
MIKLNLAPEPRILRQFAWTATFALPAIAAFLLRHDAWYDVVDWGWGHTVVLALAAVGVVQLVANLAGSRQPSLALYLVLVVVTFPIGFVLSHVLMAAIYYLVITPFALVFRLSGRDVIGRRIDRTLPTYWRDRGAPRPASSYFKLY